MKTEEKIEAMTDALSELSESYADVTQALRDTANVTKAGKKLWRSGKRSILIKAGLALIAFPDPTISDVVGSLMVAAGVVQEGIKRRTLHVDDVQKTFRNTFKELQNMKDEL
jgi:hypothetical protein